ncbi:hypothetical protein CEXT_248351 [Caerostris extrusa]|uniref:Uncharacterized protein n=1 Tax=Caerostris extrusa TaxID=172846 RepID=A0AAV4XJ83_CAEEX|nr:hypothetical protein CEXT_248351 [Caerostris extrusa]
MFLGCILFTIQFDEKNTKIYSPSSFLEEKKAHSITVFSFEREERRAQMLSDETGLFSERGVVQKQKHIRKFRDHSLDMTADYLKRGISISQGAGIKLHEGKLVYHIGLIDIGWMDW